MQRMWIILTIAAVLIWGAPAQAQETSAKGFVENMLQSVLSAEGRTVSVDGVSISFTGDVTVKRVEVKDGETPWLTIDGLALDWQPLSILRKSLQIDAITVEAVDVLRVPQSPDSGVSAPQQVGELTAADIKSLKIAKLHIAPAVMGEDTTLSIDGSGQVKAEPPEISLNLKAERTDGKQGTLTAAVVLDPRTRNISADIELNEPAGGLVAKSLRLSGDPAVDLALKANGSFDNWAGDFSLDLDQQRVLAGKAQAATDQAGMSINVDAAGNVAVFVPATLTSFFEGQSQLVAAATLPAAGGRADIQRIRVDSSGFQLRAAGVMDWAGEASDLAVELRSKDESLPIALPATTGLGKVEVTGLSADLRLTGPAANPRWNFSASAKSFNSDVFELGEPGLQIAATGVVPSGSAVMVDGSVNAALAQGERGVIPPAVLGQLRGNFAITWDDSGAIQIRGAELGAGALTFTAGGMANPGSGVFDVTLNGTAQSPETGYALPDKLLQGPVRMQGRITGDGKGAIGLDGFQLTSSVASGRFDGSFDPANVDVDIKTEINDLAALDRQIEGKARLQATLKGPRNRIETVIAADGESVTLLKQRFEQPRLRVNLILDGTAPAADLDFSGSLDGKPVAVTGKLETSSDGTRTLRNLSAKSGSAQISGELRLPKSNIPSGQFNFNAPDLRDVAPFLLMRLSGSASGRIDLEEVNSASRAKVAFKGNNIDSDSFAARSATGAFTIDDLLGQPKPQGQIAATSARLGGIAFRSLDVTARAAGNQAYDVVLKAAGDELSADGEAAIAFQNDEMTVTVNSLAGRTQGIAFRAANSFAVRKRGEAVSVGNAAFALGQGRASLDGQILPQLNARLALTSLPLSAFEKLAVPGLAGTLSGQAQLTGSFAAPNGRFELSGSGITFRALSEQGLRPIAARASGSLANGRVTLNGSAQSGQDLTTTFSGDVDIKSPGSINLTLRGKAGNRLFADRLAEQGIRLSGNAGFDLRIAGPLASPRYEGAVTLTGATFGDAEGRFIVRNASGRATIAGNVIRIERLSGATGKNGTANITGSVTLDGGPSLDIAARIRNGIYIDGTLVNTRYDADLRLAGSFAGTPRLSGRIELENAKITLSELPPTAVKPLDVKHRKAPAKVKTQIRELQARGGGGDTVDIALDIDLRASDPISIGGRGLTAVLGGRLRITGLLGSPQATGAFILRRGSLKLIARRLEFESGRLDFDNDLDPRIHLVAVSRRTDATITLTITGRATAPEIVVTSSPRMPQEEALARLIFDRSMLQLSPLQIAQIAGAIATLSGGSDNNILTKLQTALGVDWVEVTETESGETAIGIGKRINDKLSVGVEQATKGTTSRVTIDLNLTKNLKARGALGTDGSSRAGIVYEKDY